MFNWIRKAKGNYFHEVDSKAKGNYFHGVDLDNWNYVGYTNLFFNDEHGNREARAAVFGFVNKNSDSRCFSVVSSNPMYNFNSHSWVQENAELWRIGERDIWQIAQTEPSRWFVNYMKTQHHYEWNNGDWYKTDSIPVVHQESSSNVVTIEFKKS
jgi:hypothetical protein